MESQDFLTQHMHDTMVDVIVALHQNGIRNIHLGGMMRLLGVPDSIAVEHDNEYMQITDQMTELMHKLEQKSVAKIPIGTTIH